MTPPKAPSRREFASLLRTWSGSQGPSSRAAPVSLRAARRLDLPAKAALLVHATLALTLRTIAWPEVTTPAYLWSRGMVMYRDIKFVHTPGMMGSLALAFLVFGVSTWVVRLSAIVGPLVAHGFVLAETRRFGIAARIATSGFFLALLFSWQGNSLWPTVLMTALAIPIANALAGNRLIKLGLLIGCAILMKQTAAYLLTIILLRLLARRRVHDALRLSAAAAVPYALAGLGFVLVGAGLDYVRWTVVVPFRIGHLIAQAPPAASLYFVACAFGPIALQTLIEEPGEYETKTVDYLTVAVGFSLMAYPRFSFLQMCGAIPCLAVGAGRLLQSSRSFYRMFRVLSSGVVLSLSLSAGAIVLAGEAWSGKVVFWNDDPGFDTLVARVRRLSPTTRLHSTLWENLLPRSGLLPPGGVYVNPLLGQDFGLNGIDRIGEQVRRAAAAPGVVTVRYGSSGPGEGAFRIDVNP